ncbi:MAG: Polypyrimidine tract-binding protein 3 [Marteilia pararefringens]
MTARSQRSTAAKQIAAAAAATTTTSSSSSNPKSKATSSSPPSAEKNGASAAHTEFTKFYLTQIPETLSIADQSVMLQICLKHGSITGFNYLKAERIIDVGFVDSKSAKSCFEEFLNECPQLSCNRVHPVLDLEASKKRSQDQLNNNTDENSEGSDHASSKRLKISETETKGDEGDQLTENMLEDYNEHEPNTAIERSAENPAEHNDDEEPEDELGETLFNQNSLKFNAQRNASNPYSTVANGMKNPGCNEEDEDHIYERELKEEENKSEVVTDRQSTQDQQKDHTNSAPLIPDQSPKNQGKSKPGQLLKTCVIHVRNLPDSYNKNDLCRLMISYGKITHCVFMKSQAFIEYRNFTDASNLVEMCKRYQLKFHNQKIIAQFSVHERLEKSEAHSANVIIHTFIFLSCFDVKNLSGAKCVKVFSVRQQKFRIYDDCC